MTLHLVLRRKAVETLCQRSRRSLAVWVLVKWALCRRLPRTGGLPAPADFRPEVIPRAMISDWLNPRLSFLRQWRGMGTM